MSNIFFFYNPTLYEIMSTNVVEPGEPQMTSEYGEFELHAGSARLHALMRIHMSTRPGKNMHARTNTQTNK
jgi:hypothetical protein